MKFLSAILFANFAFAQSAALAVSDAYVVKRNLFNKGEALSSADIPEYAVARGYGISKNALEEVETRYVFLKKLDAKGKATIRIAEVANHALSDEDAVANLQACGNIKPAAILDRANNLHSFWGSFSNIRYIFDSLQGAVSLDVQYLRIAVVDSKSTLVGRMDVREPGFMYRGMALNPLSIPEAFFWAADSIVPVIPSQLSTPLCGKLMKDGQWQRVDPFFRSGQSGSGASRFPRM